MCGFVGFASFDMQNDSSWLETGRNYLIHRGPDDTGLWRSPDRRVGLAHQRLAVIDPSPEGCQPMVDKSHLHWIVFNGEIYNFRELRKELEQMGHTFRSGTDTEMILEAYCAWGISCVERFNGMFTFALYDSVKRSLLLARDRAGEKPIFYYLKNKYLRFASELKALLADPTLHRRINPSSLDCYLAIGYVPGDLCILKGFNKLPPAHAMQFNLHSGEAKVWRYWELPKYNAEARGQADETFIVDELEQLLEDSVKRQLVADVPVGVLLSGGVDSSLITAMAVRASNKVKTFSIRFPGYGKFDETQHARLIARYFGTDHTELEAQPATADLVPLLARQFDEPMADSSMIPTFLVSQLVRQQCTVALGGDGGDELFGGYRDYGRLLWMQHQLRWVPHSFRRAIAEAAERVLPIGFKGRNWLQGLGVDFNYGLPLIAAHFDGATRRRLMARDQSWNIVAESFVEGRVPSHPDLLQRATRMDFANYLAEDILVKVDRTSMLNSLEIRSPFLDYRIIEFAFGKVPSHLKATVQDKKILLKRLTNRVLPPEFDRQRKQGFSIPLVTWLKGGAFRDLFHDVLLDSKCIFDLRTVKELLRGQDRGCNNSERLFVLVLLELWRREYLVSY